jgi:N-acylneuraminate cytidylyltransferase
LLGRDAKEQALKTLAIIPARAGSQGIVGKNLRPFGGVPLMYRALAIGQQTCDVACISTNLPHVEGSMIVRRPDELAQDDTPMLPVVQHALQYFVSRHESPDVVVLLQPTQPLRTKLHVLEALRLLEETGADSVVSVVQIPAHYSPDYAQKISKTNRLVPWDGLLPGSGPTRRQDARPAYSRDGTVYVTRRQVIESGSLYGSYCVPLVIPSHESANLDVEDDWIRAEALVKNS